MSTSSLRQQSSVQVDPAGEVRGHRPTMHAERPQKGTQHGKLPQWLVAESAQVDVELAVRKPAREQVPEAYREGGLADSGRAADQQRHRPG